MVFSCSRMSLVHLTPSTAAATNVTTRPIETRLSRTLEVRSPLRPIAIRMSEYRVAWPVRAAPSGSKISWLMVSMSPPARSRMSALRSITASSNSISTFSPAMPGEHEGYRRGARILGVGGAHQRGRHIARAVLDIEPAGNLDLLHVLAGRHRDPGQPFHRLVLRRGRFHKVDPDRALRQRGEIGLGDFLQRGFGR